MSKIKYAFIVMLSLFITACQATKSQSTASIEQQWQVHQQNLKQINAFQVKGSIAYISDKSRSYGRFLITQQSTDNYQVKLTTPVGTNILTLKAEPNSAQLIDRHGGSYQDANVENLMKKISNVNIPLNSLHNWLKGFSDNIYTDKLDNFGRLVSTVFMQNNNKWTLKIPSYATYTYKNQKIDLPATIELMHDDKVVRLKISDWILR
ncbi:MULTISPECIES: lipoprotein insertase outer membrane protein LolB [unclassified Gilliamella]|uniref:lipoprotein insertase outer membrane protein LolB n=1 Tax=unclassified Gilliamella TaxID=2685620 RepID=UPI00080E3700|nr:lipoprotein insertase outer membrane protein LolB [Gilliamella apicola]OCG17968.1 outer membrane lipoprotein LolB [Gilliamella apicola]OCG19176.1 outer membrane lipoprotein LolB [Gilliamella apicola]OCG20224.1 outer membrane lipoprotein LolB [Gilliamella apicola]